jgi:hypothetical protein
MCTKIFSLQSYPSISLIPKIISTLQTRLSNLQNNSFNEKLLTNINKRLGYILKTPNIVLKCSALHPDYGHLDFVDEELRNKTWDSLEMDLKEILKDKEKNEDKNFPSSGDLIIHELKALRKKFEKKENTIKDPLTWWKQFYDKGGKNLYCLVEIFFSIPASSVPSERVFSSGGNIVSDYRMNLDDNNIEKLVFLRENQSKIPKTEQD